MTKIKTFQDLLAEEERLKMEISISKEYIQENINAFLQPKNLYFYLEEKMGERIDHPDGEDFNLQDYLVQLSLHLVYEQLSTKLLTSKTKKLIDWKAMLKSIIDQYYINNSGRISLLISNFISTKIEALKKKK